MTNPSWTYSATAGEAGLLVGQPKVIANNLVIALNDALLGGGNSVSFRLLTTPPNNVTPNNTSWSMQPTLTGGNIDPTAAPTPATSTATAAPLPVTTKFTADGGSVYTDGSTVAFDITASCSAASTGNLYLTSGQLVDTLPPGLIYQSSSPEGLFDSATDTVTWAYPDAASTPAGCATGSSGPNSYRVVTTAPTPAPVVEPLTNTATFSATGPDANNPLGITRTVNAKVPIQIVNKPATGPGQPGYATISKTSLAPLAQHGVSGNQYVGTYPGNWLPSGSTPSYSVGAAAASFRTTVTYGLVGTYQTEVVDPLPCLNNVSGNTYSSAAYNGAPCAEPAFHTTVIQVSSAGFSHLTGLGQAIAAGWRPTALLSNGSSVELSPTGSPGDTDPSAYFSIPTADIDLVSSIELSPNPALTNASLQLDIWGYADASLASVNSGLNKLQNKATAVPELLSGTPLVPVQASAAVFTVPAQLQLGISKVFGPTAGAPGRTTAVKIVGSVNLPAVPLAQNIVLTDLLPAGMKWANPVAKTSVALAQGGLSAGSVTATIQHLTNYQDSGRELIRVTIPSKAITSAGSWTLTPSGNFLDVTTPNALGIYVNTDQIFLYNLGSTQLSPSCNTPTQTGGGTSSATFENSNPQDLAGDGNLSEDYCQNSASLRITGTGTAFSLTKTVQGNLDSVPRGGLGIGNASNGGSGSYVLTWSNVGSDNLDDAVIYDILPHIGDTGVSRGQSGNPRGSQFAPTLSAIGALPSGVTVEYSRSYNPCRNEVYPDTSNPTCVNDWTSVPPKNLATVLAVRFFSASTYEAGDGFSVSLTVAVPAGVVNQVAWNSAATNAVDVSDPRNKLLATEPEKVGLVSPSTPSLSTKTSATSVLAHADLSDQVAIVGTGSAPGTLAWSLLGPVAPVSGSCAAIDWTGAPIESSGADPVTGDGTFITGPTTVAGPGCYTWADTLTGTAYPYSATSPAGSPGELTTVSPFIPAIATLASSSVVGSVISASDAVTVTGIPLGAPTNTLTWTLYGPVAPVGATCSGLDWAGATILASGSFPVADSGTYNTPPIALQTAGCYSFGEELPATADSVAVSFQPGDPSETLNAVAPSLTSDSSASQLKPNQAVSDSVTIAGTSGDPGELAWSLVGPVQSVDGSCVAAVWAGAPVVATGTVGSTGDETVITGPETVGAAGCYSWVDTLTATEPNSYPSPSILPAGSSNEVISVHDYQPTVSTTASDSATTNGSRMVADHISIANTGLGANPGVAAAGLTWELLGPVASSGDSCSGIVWSGAPVVARGSITVSGDGTYVTTATSIDTPGCYSFEDLLEATAVSNSASSPAGSVGETLLLPVVSSPLLNGGSGGGSGGGSSGSSGGGGSVANVGPLAFTGFNLVLFSSTGFALLMVGIGIRYRRRRAV